MVRILRRSPHMFHHTLVAKFRQYSGHTARSLDLRNRPIAQSYSRFRHNNLAEFYYHR